MMHGVAVSRLPRGRPTVAALAAGLTGSLALAAALAEPRLQRMTILAVVAAATGALILVAPLSSVFLALVATLPLADWKPGGSPLSVSVLLAFALTLRSLVELPVVRSLLNGLVIRWTLLPLLLVPAAFLGAASTGAKGQIFLSIASWFAIALLCGHFVDERGWRAVRALLIVELIVALVIGFAEIAAHRWLVPLPNPPQIQAEYFFGFFRPRSITLSPYALGEFLAFTAPLVWYELGASLRRAPLRRAPCWAALAAAQLVLLVATLSRKSLLQAGVGAIVFLCVSLSDRTVRGRILVLVAGVAAITALALAVNGPAVSERMTSNTSAEGVATRVNTFHDAVGIGVAHMPWGAGLGNFVATSTDRYGEQLAAYNSFAEAFSDAGLLGLIATLALVGVPLGAAAVATRSESPPRAVVLATMSGLIALALVESSIWRKSLAFSAGLCMALYLNSRAAGGEASAGGAT